MKDVTHGVAKNLEFPQHLPPCHSQETSYLSSCEKNINQKLFPSLSNHFQSSSRIINLIYISAKTVLNYSSKIQVPWTSCHHISLATKNMTKLHAPINNFILGPFWAPSLFKNILPFLDHHSSNISPASLHVQQYCLLSQKNIFICKRCSKIRIKEFEGI